MNLKRPLVVIICLLVTYGLLYWKPDSYGVTKPQNLAEALSATEDWQAGPMIPLDNDIVQSLRLDDYINRPFAGEKRSIFLYVGYYLTSKNVGAAHSPLVCFPGQGWLLTDSREKSVPTKAGDVKLASMIAATPQEKILLMYWFQAFRQTSPGTLMQKLNLIRSRIVHGREDNAFVRITIPMKDRTREQAFAIGSEFIKAFYPDFLAYIQQTGTIRQ